MHIIKWCINSRFEIKKITPFQLRLFTVFLAIILSLNFICKPKEINAAVVGTTLTIGEIVSIIACVTGIVGLGYEIWKECNDGGTEQEFQSYFNENITVDGSGNYVLSDDAMIVVNQMKEEAEKEITYQYGYFPSYLNLPADKFYNKNAYDIIYEIIKANPDKMFAIDGFTHNSRNNAGWTVDNYGYEHFDRIRFTDIAYAAVSKSDALSVGTPEVTLYDDDWSSSLTWYEFIIFDNDSHPGHLVYRDSEGTNIIIDDVDAAKNFNLSNVCTTVDNGCTTYLANLYPESSSSPWSGNSTVSGLIFTNYQGGVPIFVTESEMKKGTSNGTQGVLLPNYATGNVTNNTVTSQDINDYSTTYNYYYGTNNPDDDSGDDDGSGGSGSSSSGNWLTSLLNTIDNLGNVILSIVSKLLEVISSILDFFTSGILDALDIIPTRFVEFVGAFFPYIPEEWIQAVNLFFGIILAGLIIKIVKSFF